MDLNNKLNKSVLFGRTFSRFANISHVMRVSLRDGFQRNFYTFRETAVCRRINVLFYTVILPDCSYASNDEYYLKRLPLSPTLRERKNHYLRFFRAATDMTLSPVLTQTAWAECFCHRIPASRIIHGWRRVNKTCSCISRGSTGYYARISS